MNESESDVDMYRADKIILEDTFHRISRWPIKLRLYVGKHRLSLLLYFYLFKYVDIARLL